jgi:RIO kinase 1
VLTSGNNAILMSYIGDETTAAPILHSVALSRREASRIFERVIENIDLMLSIGRVHGDLSAYNILYWQGEIYLIDFPQTIDPEINRNAYWIFSRDVIKICDYFKRQGVKSDAQQIAKGLWKKYNLKVVPDVHPGMLDFEDEGDMSYWKLWSEIP